MARLIRKPPPRRQLGGGEGYAAWIGQHRSAISQVATAAAFKCPAPKACGSSEPDLDRERLAKLLGKMGSDCDTEVLLAARKADQLVRSSVTTWPDVIDPRGGVLADSAEELVAEALELIWYATRWERNFILNLSRWRAPLSRDQLDKLSEIVMQLQERRAA